MISEYQFDELVVGGSLESLLYCYFNNKPILILEELYPFKLQKVNFSKNLKFAGYSANDTIYKSELWDRLTFIMGFNGQIVCPNIVKSHRYKDGKFTLVTDHNKRITLLVDQVINFDKTKRDKYFVYDWFNVRSGNNHDKLLLVDDNNFISKVYFFTPNRIGANHRMKDLVGESLLTGKEISSPNFSEGIARLKILTKNHLKNLDLM